MADLQLQRRLVFLDRAPGKPCCVCGYGFTVPTEARQLNDALAHVQCAAAANSSVRGGW